MADGVLRCGDIPIIADVRSPIVGGDAAVIWGWKRRDLLKKYRQFAYVDLGYWGRDQYFRVSVNGWSPDYVQAGMSSKRFKRLGLEIKPWNPGSEILIAGCSPKSAADHNLGYMEWEENTAKALKNCGYPVMYRPKPTDRMKRPIDGIGYDTRPIGEAMAAARAVVTHHSNSAVDALLAGIPTHCETGAAACMSVPLDQVFDTPEPAGRVQFLYDVAWLQWTMEEMKSGECWNHLKERGLIC